MQIWLKSVKKSVSYQTNKCTCINKNICPGVHAIPRKSEMDEEKKEEEEKKTTRA